MNSMCRGSIGHAEPRPGICGPALEPSFEIFAKDSDRRRSESGVQIDQADKVADRLIGGILCRDRDSKGLINPLSFGGLRDLEMICPSGSETPNRTWTLADSLRHYPPGVRNTRNQTRHVPIGVGSTAEQLVCGPWRGAIIEVDRVARARSFRHIPAKVQFQWPARREIRRLRAKWNCHRFIVQYNQVGCGRDETRRLRRNRHALVSLIAGIINNRDIKENIASSRR